VLEHRQDGIDDEQQDEKAEEQDARGDEGVRPDEAALRQAVGQEDEADAHAQQGPRAEGVGPDRR
jgi:hypothetical protein